MPLRRISGVKKWITGGMMADYFTVLAKTKDSGFCMFLVERDVRVLVLTCLCSCYPASAAVAPVSLSCPAAARPCRARAWPAGPVCLVCVPAPAATPVAAVAVLPCSCPPACARLIALTPWVCFLTQSSKS